MFDKQQANTIFWSPQGQFVVLAGLRRWVSAACCCTEHHCGDPDLGPCGSWQLLDTVMGCPCVKGLSPFFLVVGNLSCFHLAQTWAGSSPSRVFSVCALADE